LVHFPLARGGGLFIVKNKYAKDIDNRYSLMYNGITMKERDTKILPVRIKKDILEEVNRIVKEKKSRNSWVNEAITTALKKERAT
jgi:hypothetical protein